MDITPTLTASQQLIHAYGNGGFTIAGRRIEGTVLVFSEYTVPLPLQRFDEIDVDALEILFEVTPQPEILLIGSGESQHFMPPPRRQAFRARGLTVDVMNTGAACRTFNVLLAEGRRVASLLLPF